MSNNIVAVVEHNYTQKEPDELSLKKGETIYKIKILSEGWWQGVNSAGKKGMFPENFVRIVNDNDVILRNKNSTTHKKCRAIYSYDQNKEDELSLAVGDIVEILGEAEEGWWQGQLNGKKGVFPSNFVTVIETASSQDQINISSDILKESNKTINCIKTNSTNESNNSEVPSLPPKRQKECCQVEFAYSPQNEDELQLNVGDIITIVSKDAQDVGWWKGEINGKVGVFPDNFVKLLPQEGLPKSGSSSKIYIRSEQKNTSFGSRDSLKDILSETGLQIGNVVQQRLSLENKNLDFSNGLNESNVLKYPADNEKSSESLEDKKTAPPTLPKKPVVSSKKTGSVSTVAGNIISGIKKSVKSVEQKLQTSTTSSHDTSDGIHSSKFEIAEHFNKNVKIEKIKFEDDFNDIERTTTMLQDVRASRVKAPKRRPPTSNNVAGNENNNYINGSSYNENVEVIRNQMYIKTEKEENNRISKNIPSKMNVPWMAELKANQERKKIPLNRENTGYSSSTSESSSSRSVSVKENVVSSETASSRCVTTTTMLDNVKMSNQSPEELDKDKLASTILPSKASDLPVLKATKEGESNISKQNNNTIDAECVGSHNKILELEKRVQNLESIVEQLRQELLSLKNDNESNSISKVVKNEVEKYV